jgi:small subunit ribosomal protein S2
MLTNWKTISGSIKRLRELDDRLTNNTLGLTKKELLMLTRDRDKLERALGGIKDMGGQPDILVVIDTLKEQIAIQEAKVLNIPVVAVCDSNSDPTNVTYPVPGNDDATRAIAMYCDLFAGSVLDGLQQEAISHGKDIGEAEELPAEALPAPAEDAGQAANA